MHIVLVHVHVKQDKIEEFSEAILENARNSILEEGVVRFDVLQQTEDPSQFTLVEVYQNPEAQLKHRETQHYLKWRDSVVDWMAEPRTGIKYSNLFPGDTGWKKS
jgi:(4S)-4-hydroxy-5-phosphonooxypentane-2,3-dione isomerase